MSGPNPDPADKRGLTRETLYARVWTTPMRTLAGEFGMSDRGLAKLCERHAIPVPGLGYWRRKETGKRVRQLPLPQLHPNHQHLADVRLPDAPEPESRVIVTPRPKPEPPPDPPLVAAQRAFEATHPIVAGELPERPHPVVRATRSGLRKAKDGTTDLVHAVGDNAFNVSVTGGTRDRALRIVQALCLAFKHRGFGLAARDGDRRATTIKVHGHTVTILLEERLQRRERPKRSKLEERLDPHGWNWERYEYVPTGELVLKASLPDRAPQKWSDGKRQPLEAKLNDLMIGVVAMVESEIRWQQERLASQRREAEAQVRRMKEEERRREEEQRGKDLADLAGEWDQAGRLRAFVTAVRAQAEREGRLSPDNQLDRWLQWADDYIADCEPLNRLDAFPPPYKRKTYWDDRPADPWPACPPAAATSPGPPRPGTEGPVSDGPS